MRIAAAETFMLGHEPLPVSLRRLEAAGFDSVEIIVPHRIADDATAAEIVAMQGELANTGLDGAHRMSPGLLTESPHPVKLSA